MAFNSRVAFNSQDITSAKNVLLYSKILINKWQVSNRNLRRHWHFFVAIFPIYYSLSVIWFVCKHFIVFCNLSSISQQWSDVPDININLLQIQNFHADRSNDINITVVACGHEEYYNITFIICITFYITIYCLYI